MLAIGRRTLVFAYCASPLLLILGATDWLLTPIGYIDAWHYIGFFHDYGNPQYSAGAYKLARLPWILAGWIVHRVLSGTTAAYCLHAIFLVASTTGMFVLVRDLFGARRIGLLAAVFLGFHAPFHGAGGWDYHNTAAGAFYVWALVAVTKAAANVRTRSLVAAGAITALAVHSSITYAPFLPILVLHYVAMHRRFAGRWPTPAHVGMAAAWGAAGAVAITALLSTVNVLAGREALFFGQLFDMTARYVRDTSNLSQWWQPWSDWFWAATYLTLSAAMVLLAPFVLMANRASRGARKAAAKRLVALEFLVMAFAWLAWQAAGNITLSFDKFAYPLLPHAVLALAALVATRVPTVPAAVLVAAPLVLATPLSFGLAADIMPLLPPPARVPMVLAAISFLLSGAVLWLPRRVRAMGCVVWFAVGNAFAAWPSASYSWRSPCHTAPEAYQALLDAYAFVSGEDPALANTGLWFEESDMSSTAGGCRVPISYVGYSLAGTGVRYFGRAFPMQPLPELPDSAFDLGASQLLTVAVITSDPDRPAAFLQRAVQADVESSVVAARRFDVEDATFYVTLVRLEPSQSLVRRVARSPGELLGEWDTEALSTQLGNNAYGSPGDPILERTTDGRLLFVPGTPRDHVVLPFMPVPQRSRDRTLLIGVEAGSRERVNCTAFVQDQDFRLLGRVPCGDPAPGRREVAIPLPPDVTSIRLYFLSGDERPMVLPQHLRIAHHHEDEAVAPLN